MFFGRRNLRIGDVVAFDTPFLNGVADVIAGPDSERGTKVYPKWLFRFRWGVLVDKHADNVFPLNSSDELWLEDNANYTSIVGVDIDESALK